MRGGEDGAMGNLCDCFEQQPPPEEKKPKKELKTRLSAQQLIASTESPAVKKKENASEEKEPEKEVEPEKQEEEDKSEQPVKEQQTEDKPNEKEEEEDKLEGASGTTTIEVQVETHEDVAATEEPVADDGGENDTTSPPAQTKGEEDKQPLLAAAAEAEEETGEAAVEEEEEEKETTETAVTERRKSSSSSSSSSSSEEEEEEVTAEDEEEEEPELETQQEAQVQVAGGSRLMRAFVDGCQIRLSSLSSSRTLRIMDDGSVNGMGGNGKKATFTVHVKGVKKVALQNFKDPEKWLQVKDDDISGNGTGDEHCHFSLSEHSGYVVLEPVLAPGTHIGVRENGKVKKPSHTGTRKHARFTPIMKDTSLDGESPILASLKTGRGVSLTSRASGKSLRIVEKEVNGLGGEGDQASFYVHVRRGDVVALQNVKDPQSWLRIKDSKMEGNGRGGKYCEFKVKENDGYLTLESLETPGNYVGIDSDGNVTSPAETDPASETAHFTPHVKYQTAGDSDLLSRFAEENVIVLESRASGKTLRFREGEVEGKGGHGALAQFIVHVKGSGVVALQNKKEPKRWLRIINEKLNARGKGGILCHWNVQEVDGHVVLESVRYPGQHVGVRETGEVKKPAHTGKGAHAQFTPIVIAEDDDTAAE